MNWLCKCRLQKTIRMWEKQKQKVVVVLLYLCWDSGSLILKMTFKSTRSFDMLNCIGVFGIFFFAFCNTHIQNNISAVIIDFAFGTRINYILIINDIYILLYTVLPKILTRYQLLCNFIVLLHCEQKQIKLLYATMEIIFDTLFVYEKKSGNWVANYCVNFIDFWVSNKFVIFLSR